MLSWLSHMQVFWLILNPFLNINAKISDLLFAGIVYDGAQVSQLVTPRPPSSVSQAAVK